MLNIENTIKTQPKKDKYSFMLLADFHMQKFQVQNLISYYQDMQLQSPDYILLLGDFDNLPNTDIEQYQDEKQCMKSEERISTLIEPLLQYFVDSTVLFIPGNHDPYTLFYPTNNNNQNNQISEKFPGRAYNVHNKVIDLGNGLKVLGFGGSIPGIEEETEQKVWDGFPFSKGDQEFKSELEALINNKLQKNDQVLFMTHMGPHASISSQSRFTSEKKYIQAGSQYLADLITDENKEYNIIGNVHGHVHDAQGTSMVKNTKIVNAGPICQGQFTQIQLKVNSQKQWKCVQTQFHEFN